MVYFKKYLFLFIPLLLLAIVGTLVFLNKNPNSVKKQLSNITNTPVQKKCPSGFILVPGDPVYHTRDFCVMKYDAKCTNPDPKCVTKEGVYRNNTPGCSCQNNYLVVSTTLGAPITYVPEDNGTDQSAKVYCQNAGWHLMTNNEWMTIARNVEKIPDNWCDKNGTNCGNAPGAAGKILANGHNDSNPAMALVAVSDNEPCFGTTTDGSDKCGGKSSQKRTLTLSNGEVIWDLAGNVWQWIDIEIARKDEPRSKIPGLGGTAWVWAEFSTVAYDDSYSPSNPNWDSSLGVGRIYHYNLSGDTNVSLYTFIRGGNWRHGYDSGPFTVHMSPAANKENIDDVGFRCAAN